ncbi:hypothetical protein ACQW02_04425 [Humitalea sp. 24SJ18S-53]|uniref:hypothetical protein n=1 Tax=Humitalea sp. 24SJ18S-53 TaxID=3422307 RepID=UPI003D673FD8
MTIADQVPWLLAVAALAGVVALLLLLGRAARAFGFGAAAPRGGPRRLILQDSLAIDPKRRLVLVRCDGRDVLLLTGGGSDQVVGWLA